MKWHISFCAETKDHSKDSEKETLMAFSHEIQDQVSNSVFVKIYVFKFLYALSILTMVTFTRVHQISLVKVKSICGILPRNCVGAYKFCYSTSRITQRPFKITKHLILFHCSSLCMPLHGILKIRKCPLHISTSHLVGQYLEFW